MLFSLPASNLSDPESIKWRIIAELAACPLSKLELAKALGHASISGKLKQRIRQMLSDGYIEYTIPDKPNSRLQKYRLTDAGKQWNEANLTGVSKQ